MKERIVYRAKRIAYQFVQNPVPTINIILLIICLTLGFALYADKFYGAHDDITRLPPMMFKSEWDYLVYMYHETGFIGLALAVAPFRWLVRTFGLTPETFPWWLPASVNLFCIIGAPINLVASAKNLSRCSVTASVYLLLLIWGMWTISPIVYDTSLFLPVTLLVSHTSLYFLSLGLWLWSRPTWGQHKWEWGVLGAIYVSVLLAPTLLPSAIILFVGMSFLKFIFQKYPIRLTFLSIGLWLGIAIILIVFLFTATGFYRRSKQDYNVTLPPLSSILRDWYKPIPFGYATFPHSVEGESELRPWHKTGAPFRYTVKSTYISDRGFVIIHVLLLAMLTASIGLTSFAYFRVHNVISQSLEIQIRKLLGTLSLALTCVVAFHGSVVFYFFTPHFWEYSKPLPSLFVVAGWTFTVWSVIQISDPIMQYHLLLMPRRNTPPFANDDSTVTTSQTPFLLGICLLCAIFFFITLPNIGRVIDTYRYEIRLGEQRYKTRQSIIDVHIRTKQTNFLLSDCPSGFDTYWAFGPYFEWRGYPSIQVIMEDAPNYGPALKNDPQWVQLPCTDGKFVTP